MAEQEQYPAGRGKRAKLETATTDAANTNASAAACVPPHAADQQQQQQTLSAEQQQQQAPKKRKSVVMPTPIRPPALPEDPASGAWDNAVLLIDKPQGWTSFDVCGKLRGALARLLGRRPRDIKAWRGGEGSVCACAWMTSWPGLAMLLLRPDLPPPAPSAGGPCRHAGPHGHRTACCLRGQGHQGGGQVCGQGRRGSRAGDVTTGSPAQPSSLLHHPAARSFMAMRKEYSGTLRLGEGTDTYDAEGKVGGGGQDTPPPRARRPRQGHASSGSRRTPVPPCRQSPPSAPSPCPLPSGGGAAALGAHHG